MFYFLAFLTVFFVQWFNSSPRTQNCWTRFLQQGINTAFLTWRLLQVLLVKWLDIKKNYTNGRRSRERSIYIGTVSAKCLCSCLLMKPMSGNLLTLVIWNPSYESETNCTKGCREGPKISLLCISQCVWRLVAVADGLFCSFWCTPAFLLPFIRCTRSLKTSVIFTPTSYFFMLPAMRVQLLLLNVLFVKLCWSLLAVCLFLPVFCYFSGFAVLCCNFLLCCCV